METKERAETTILYILYTYLAPQGDGNAVALFGLFRFFGLYTYLAPQGDGNDKYFEYLSYRYLKALHLPRPARGWKPLLAGGGASAKALYTYLAPQGDGNCSPCCRNKSARLLLYTYLAPQGDGNPKTWSGVALRRIAFTLTSPRKGMETRDGSLLQRLVASALHLPRPARGWKLGAVSTREGVWRLYTYLAPQGDGNTIKKQIAKSLTLTLHLPRPERGWKRTISHAACII